MPARINPRTAKASKGAAIIGIHKRNKATAQKIKGVMIHVL
jgi:hypothetical protein